MAKILVLYYSMYGHIETMANAVAEGTRRVPGAEVDILQVPETIDAGRFAQVGGKTEQAAAEATPEVLTQYDAPLSSVPKPASAICPARRAPSRIAPVGCGPRVHCAAKSAASSPQPAPVAVRINITSVWTTLAHHGIVIVPIDYGTQEMFDISRTRGDKPYGVSTLGRRGWFASAHGRGTVILPVIRVNTLPG